VAAGGGIERVTVKTVARPFTRCGIAWDKARPRAKRLSGQTQGGWVK
jgi:hypothetical protein